MYRNVLRLKADVMNNKIFMLSMKSVQLIYERKEEEEEGTPHIMSAHNVTVSTCMVIEKMNLYTR